MTITTKEDFRRIGREDGRAIAAGESPHIMFSDPESPDKIAYLEGVVAGLRSAILDPSDELKVITARTVEPKEVTYLVFGTGGLSYPWWGSVTWEALVGEDEWGEITDYADLDIAEPTDRLTIVSWDGDIEGGSKTTVLTFAEIVAAVTTGVARGLLDGDHEGVLEDLGLFDAPGADLVLQLAVFGDPVYG